MQILQALILLSKLRIVVSVVFTSIVGFYLPPEFITDKYHVLVIAQILTFMGISASIVNNILDYEMDTHMERTQHRQHAIELLGKPLLWIFALCLLCFALFCTYLFFSISVMFLSICTYFSYVAWYTLILKKRSPFGVILGGLPGALPILIGYLASHDTIRLPGYIVFLYMMLWQPAHFWILSLKLQEEYAKGSIPVLPNIYGEKITQYFIYLYILLLLPIVILFYFTVMLSMMSFLFIMIVHIIYAYVSFQSCQKRNYNSYAFMFSIVCMLCTMGVLLLNSILIHDGRLI